MVGEGTEKGMKMAEKTRPGRLPKEKRRRAGEKRPLKPHPESRDFADRASLDPAIQNDYFLLTGTNIRTG